MCEGRTHLQNSESERKKIISQTLLDCLTVSCTKPPNKNTAMLFDETAGNFGVSVGSDCVGERLLAMLSCRVSCISLRLRKSESLRNLCLMSSLGVGFKPLTLCFNHCNKDQHEIYNRNTMSLQIEGLYNYFIYNN